MFWAHSTTSFFKLFFSILVNPVRCLLWSAMTTFGNHLIDWNGFDIYLIVEKIWKLFEFISILISKQKKNRLQKTYTKHLKFSTSQSSWNIFFDGPNILFFDTVDWNPTEFPLTFPHISNMFFISTIVSKCLMLWGNFIAINQSLFCWLHTQKNR